MRRGSWSSSRLGLAGTAMLSATSGSSASRCSARRWYTPIWVEKAPSDALSAMRTQDEVEALWPPAAIVPDIPSAIAVWTRMRNDPVLHTQLHPRKPSAFSNAEDVFGTNLVSPHSREHLKDSVLLWTEYYEKKYLAALRHSRRTAANYIGTLTAPEQFLDEADRPETTWHQDTYFKEVSFLSERALREKVANLEQFEIALKRADAASYLAFHDVFATQTQTLIPLPTLSLWAYDGERRKAWVEAFKPIEAASLAFFEDKLKPALKAASWETVAKDAAAVLREVGKVQVARNARQITSGTRKAWSTMTKEEMDRVALSEVITRERSIADGDYDAEDSLDTSEEWLHEQAAINTLMQAPLASHGFSTQDLWMHTIRFEGFSTEHVYTDQRAQRVAAAALVAMYSSGVTVAHVVEAMASSLEKSTIDLRASTLVPATNDIWCRLHWHKFASGSSIVHHTTTSKRQLHFHHFEGTKMIAAAAALYFHTKPLSSTLDYSTPYKYRRSLAALCAKYGVEYSYAVQRPLLGSAANLNRAEEVIGAVVTTVARPLGAIRRQADDAARKRNATRLTSVSSAVVRSFGDATTSETQWALGSARSVAIEWPTPPVVEFQANPGASAAERAIRELELKSKGIVQVVLMRHRTAADTPNQLAKLAVEQERVRTELDKMQTAMPQLKEIEASARQTYAWLTNRPYPEFNEAWAAGAAAEKEAVERSDWEFVTTLDDSHPLTRDGVLEVVLPYTFRRGLSGEAKRIEAGTYCLRIRCINYGDNPNADATWCSETSTAPFAVFDALPQLTEQFFKVKDVAKDLPSFDGASLSDFCQFLRDAQLSVSTKFEFDVGQNVGPKGQVYFSDFVERLQSGKFMFVAPRDRYTTPQLEAEPRVRAHWELYHPGATDDEWQAVRRRELDHAFESSELDWWVPDEMLTPGSMTPFSQLHTLRYADDVCQVLDATAQSTDGAVTATFSGRGTVASLAIDDTLVKRKNMTLQEVLASATSALQGAQCRLNTLAAAKVGGVHKESQVLSLLGQHHVDFGGRHGRTYRYAFDKARDAVDSKYTVTDQMREEEVDRFASSTHPEQRRTHFSARVNASNMPMDDVAPNRLSNWGNSI